MSVTPPTLPYQPKGPRRWSPVLAWIGCVVIVLLFVLSSLLPSFNRPQDGHSPLQRCASDLRQIGQAVQLYANENRGHFPPKFRLLWTTQDLDSYQVACPGTYKNRPTTLPSPEEFDSVTDYVYLGAGLTDQAHPDIVLAHDRPANHGNAVNILFADGRVDRFPTADLPQLLAKSAALRTPTSKPAK